jgi:transcriptional regulator with XRE-family HTH domain
MANKTQNNDPMSSATARGKRLKTARLMAGLTRKGLEKKYGISASTIQSWEAAKAGGLTERGVTRVIPILRQEGIFCTNDWLLYGVGNAPQPTNVHAQRPQEAMHSLPDLPEDKVIVQELLAFRDLNANVVDLIVTDDGMSPHYHPTDYIGGKRRNGEDIAELIGSDCIVETSNNEIFLRRLRPGSRTGVYTLTCTNPDTTVLIPTLYDQQLMSAAPVIWHRRHDVG